MDANPSRSRELGCGPLGELAELARHAREGDRAALEALLERSVGLVHTIARARLGPTLDADSAAVDALAEVASGIAKLRDPRAYPAWLRRVTTRCANRERRRWRKNAAPPPPQRDTPASVPAPHSAPGLQPEVLDALTAREDAARVRDALAAMSPRIREPLLLHFGEDLAYREIATVLGTSLGTVARRIKEGLARLRRQLGESE